VEIYEKMGCPIAKILKGKKALKETSGKAF